VSDKNWSKPTEINPFDVRIADRQRPLDSDWVEQLKASIAEIGLTTPITVGPDLTLIAGHHRLAACRALGMKRIPALMVKLDELRTELAEIDENLIRNELTVLERSEHLDRRKEIYEALHPESKHGGTKGNQHTGKIQNSDLTSFVDDTASKTGRSRSSVAEEVQIGKRLAPDVKEKLRGTEVADRKQDLLTIAQLTPELQRKIVDAPAEKIIEQAREIRAAKQKEKTEERREKLRLVTLDEAVQGKFQVIYADPPWQYSNTGFDGSAEGQYPTMATDDICAMPVGERAATNSVLLMWATWPLLKDALRVMDAWGFEYKTGAPWKKNVHVGGFYFLGITEFILVGVRGSCTPRKAPIGFFEFPRTKHSAKPHEFYDVIEGMYDGPYLELFARNQRPNWTAFGNDPAVAKKAG
jgi:N6-adenosine-specific RNA methylase IME4